MDHQTATQLEAVDKYLLNELTPQVRDEFEEHYFDCQECSTDLRATAAFMDAAGKEFKSRPAAKPTETASARTRMNFMWRPAVLAFALAASLLVIVYQNAVVYPGFRNEIAQLQAPEVLPTLSLIGANSRGSSNPSVAVGNAKRVQLVFEIPAQEQFTSYECLLYSPSGVALGKVQISSQAAKDTVTMDAPTGERQAGNYHLVVKGKSSRVPAESDATVQDYSFALSGN